MPYFHFAGRENDPANHAEKHGLRIRRAHRIPSTSGLHKGDFTIYKLVKADAA